MKNLDEAYVNELLVRTAHHSTAIEGNSLSLEETRGILLDESLPKAGKTREYFEVKNYKEAFAYLLDKLTPKGLNSNKILAYHSFLMKDILSDNGRFKHLENVICGASFETAKPYLVPTLIHDLCENHNFRLKNASTFEEKIEIIMDTHIKFERIHPFSDGNGRTGRMLVMDACLHENIPAIIIPCEEKDKYITFLNASDLKGLASWACELGAREGKSF